MSERTQTGIALIVLTLVLFVGAVALQMSGLDHAWAQSAFLVALGGTLRHLIGGLAKGPQ